MLDCILSFLFCEKEIFFLQGTWTKLNPTEVPKLFRNFFYLKFYTTLYTDLLNTKSIVTV